MAPEILSRTKQLVEPALKSAIKELSLDIALSVNYHFGWVDEFGVETEGGGKGIRSALAILSAEYVGADVELAIPGAVAVELVHNFSLIHDDVIDKDDERRHRATVWKVFGVEDALLSGDALLALAFQVLLDTDPKVISQDNAKLASTELVRATSEMIAGQWLDMKTNDSTTVEVCQSMEAQKTGALLSCSAAIGAILAGAELEQIAALRVYGMELGLAFQAIDDLLGIWGDSEVTGKPAGNDIQENKRSLPIVLAIQNSDDNNKEALIEALSKENKKVSDISDIVSMLEEQNVREATQEIANQHLELALLSISEENATGKTLQELAKFVTSRNF